MGGPSDEIRNESTTSCENQGLLAGVKAIDKPLHLQEPLSDSQNGSRGRKEEETRHGEACTNGFGKPKGSEKSNIWTILGFAIIIFTSYVTLPPPLKNAVKIGHVWYHGWITALSTGLGIVPLLFTKKLDRQWLGISNGIAAGMMLSATFSLIYEGITLEADEVYLSSVIRVAIGVGLGLLFIVLTKNILDEYQDLKIGSLSGVDARKVMLIVFVMTLHSFSEGVGIGVSFGGKAGNHLGVLISATLAVHNVPEGLAVALVLQPRGVSRLNTALWCIITSLPQPLMAVPAFLFVEEFLPFLPVGLGFAAGAMFWVACFELYMESAADTSHQTAMFVTSTAFCIMLCVQNFMKEEI